MATIKISNLYPAGSELFGDSESYLNELNDEELYIAGGGRSSFWCGAIVSGVVSATSTVSIATAVTYFTLKPIPVY